MIIIGEKINGFVPKTLEAIKAHDDEYIKYIAKAQADAGATYIDVCAGVEPEIEHETMKWLMDLVQSVTDTPLCIDSPDPQVVVDMMPYANEVGCLNSISMEGMVFLMTRRLSTKSPRRLWPRLTSMASTMTTSCSTRW